MQEESGQSCYLAEQVNLLRAQLCSAGIEPAAEEAAIAAQVKQKLNMVRVAEPGVVH